MLWHSLHTPSLIKILISSLGTGQRADGSYSKAKYEIADEVYETSFIADALNKHLNFDKIFLVGTRKSIWDEAYMVFGGTVPTRIEYKETLALKASHHEVVDIGVLKKEFI